MNKHLKKIYFKVRLGCDGNKIEHHSMLSVCDYQIDYDLIKEKHYNAITWCHFQN